jgi:hypothetical protein
MAEDINYLKIRLEWYKKRLDNENNESKRISFKNTIAEIEQQINEVELQSNPNDLNYLKKLEKFLECQLNDHDELNNTIGIYDSKKTLEETNHHQKEQSDKIIKQEIETGRIYKNEQIINQIDVNLIEAQNYDEKRKEIDEEKNACETELAKNENELFKTDLDVQRGQKDVEITNSRIEDYGNLEKRLQDTIDNRTSDSKKKEKEALLLQAEINVSLKKFFITKINYLKKIPSESK